MIDHEKKELTEAFVQGEIEDFAERRRTVDALLMSGDPRRIAVARTAEQHLREDERLLTEDPIAYFDKVAADVAEGRDE